MDLKSTEKAFTYPSSILVTIAPEAYSARLVVIVTCRVHDRVRLRLTFHLQLSVRYPSVLGKLDSAGGKVSS